MWKYVDIDNTSYKEELIKAYNNTHISYHIYTMIETLLYHMNLQFEYFKTLFDELNTRKRISNNRDILRETIK